jgi:ribonucleases P/MRP protein subunit RPP40
VWSPYLAGDIKLLEQVQHRATKMIPQLSHLSYEDRLKRLNLTTLEQRRERGDLIEMYKIAYQIEIVKHPVFAEMRPGGHEFKLKREYVVSCLQRHNFFFNSLISRDIAKNLKSVKNRFSQ